MASAGPLVSLVRCRLMISVCQRVSVAASVPRLGDRGFAAFVDDGAAEAAGSFSADDGVDLGGVLSAVSRTWFLVPRSPRADAALTPDLARAALRRTRAHSRQEHPGRPLYFFHESTHSGAKSSAGSYRLEARPCS